MILLSVDIETTGLRTTDPRSQVLSMGVILFDTNNAVLDKYELFFDLGDDELLFDNFYVLDMHKNLIRYIAKLRNGECPEKSYHYLLKNVNEAYTLLAHMLNNNAVYGKPYLIGKNLALFDIPMMDWLFPKLVQEKKINHRIIDIGNLYMNTSDTNIPCLKTCMERAGIEGVVPHTALGDADLVLNLFMRWRENGRGEGISRAA